MKQLSQRPWKLRHNGKSWTIRNETELIVKIEDKNSSSEANAKLIFASLDLLEASQALLELYLDHPYQLADSHHLWISLEKALRKAGGSK